MCPYPAGTRRGADRPAGRAARGRGRAGPRGAAPASGQAVRPAQVACWTRGGLLTRQAPIAVALDVPDLETAARWAGLVTPHVSTVKIGLELYLRYGPGVVASVQGASGVKVFLDLKLHDIPATVTGAARAVARL